jgi:hypothetical protein
MRERGNITSAAYLIVAFRRQNEIISLWKRSIILFNITLVCLLHKVNKKKAMYSVKLRMGNAFLAEKKLYFIMKLFHFVTEKRL